MLIPRWTAKQATAIVTGASSGIGRELSRQLCAGGARVYAVARRGDKLTSLADESAELEGEVVAVVGDITEPEFREALLGQVASESEALDLLVNNAGVGGIGPFEDASAERLRTIMEVNFFAAVELTRSSLPMLRRGKAPVICNISSVLGHCAVANKSEYCASKFAIHGWSDALRMELAEQGIHVCLVSPSTTASEFFEASVGTESRYAKRRQSASSPGIVARSAMKAIARHRNEVILTLGGKLLVWADRICPPLMHRILSRFK